MSLFGVELVPEVWPVELSKLLAVLAPMPTSLEAPSS
jgi:hypothetical protein